MNNKEKRKYMTDLLLFQTTPLFSEIATRKDFLKNTPNFLFKFRSFDRYAFEMIEDGYAYLTPVNGLDDPFDCLNDFSIKEFYNEKTHKITPKAIDFIIKLICPNGIQHLSSKEVKKLALQCIKEDGIDYEKVPKIVTVNGDLVTTEFEPFFIMLNTFNENFEAILESTKIDGFAMNAMSPGDRVGICSLSEKRDNKVMWSLYGDNYSGYCIEYEIQKKKEILFNLCPVIYTKRSNNLFIEKLIEYAVAAFMRTVTNGHQVGNIGASMELFCTKDTDWSYQSEWRLIGEASNKFNSLNIKAIYLGFKVKESYVKKMKKLAKIKGFELFKMNPPNGKKKISYRRIS